MLILQVGEYCQDVKIRVQVGDLNSTFFVCVYVSS